MPVTNLIEVISSDEEAEVVDATYVKRYLGIETAVHDTLLDTLIVSAREEFEKASQVSVIKRQVTAIWSEAYTFVRLPLIPHGTIISVKNTADTVLVLDSNYTVQGTKEKRIYGDFSSGLKVNYDAGYEAADVPELIKLAITKNVVENFEIRTGISAKNTTLLPNNWRKVALKYRPTWMF